MVYVIAGLILLFILKVVLDIVASQREAAGNKAATGRVIDISDKWINIDSMPYRRRDRLMTPAELAIYQEIAESLEGSRYAVLPKIPLAEIIAVPANAQNRTEYMERAREKTLDLVLLELPDYVPVLVISLEEGSSSKKQQLADIFTEKAVCAAGYPYMRINLTENPDVSRLINSFKKLGINVQQS